MNAIFTFILTNLSACQSRYCTRDVLGGGLHDVAHNVVDMSTWVS